MSTIAPNIKQFRIDIPDAELSELELRLERTRWPDELPGSGWDYGVPQTLVRDLVDYWRTGYDWRAEEARLNAHPQFMTDDRRPAACTSCTFDRRRRTRFRCCLLHGWPGSVAEFLDVIGPLSDPASHGGDAADAFHLVIPSLPGFGFSGPTTDEGWNAARTAAAFAELMRRLGYDRYGAQGGDLGALIAPRARARQPRPRRRHPPECGDGRLHSVGPDRRRRARDVHRRREGTARANSAFPFAGWERLLPDPRQQAADDRLRAHRLAGRPACVGSRSDGRLGARVDRGGPHP